MSQMWSSKDALGEFTGSFILALAALFIFLVSKSRKMNLDTVLKQRGFVGITTFAAIMVGAMTSKSMGAHGQINPGVTLIVAVVEKEFGQVPMLIAFQLLGSIFAFLIFMLTMKLNKKEGELKDVFKWSKQSYKRTGAIESLGNVFWFLPIATMYVLFTRTESMDFFELLIVASFGKMILILVIGEIGHGNYNPMVWFANFLTIFIVQKKIGSKQLINELTGTITSLLIGLASGAIALGSLQLM